LTALVAVVDEGYRLNELTGDAGTIAETDTAIAVNGDCSTRADFVKQCICS